jgi:hypothetical protein
MRMWVRFFGWFTARRSVEFHAQKVSDEVIKTILSCFDKEGMRTAWLSFPAS